MKALEVFEIAKNFNLVNEKLNDIYARIKECARWGGYETYIEANNLTDVEVAEILQSDGFKIGAPNWVAPRLISWNLEDKTSVDEPF